MYRRTIIFQSLQLLLSARLHREIKELHSSKLITHAQLDPRIKVVGQPDTLLFVDHYGSLLIVKSDLTGKVSSYQEGAVSHIDQFVRSCRDSCDWRLAELDSTVFEFSKPLEAAL